ncbi:hypothetical protein AYK26_01695 [Euryarchaeota archaeon SM23-78]|nr:MAG: hypothetical protein AYK26_01695 [Euryarchaeota archaeon SM23-78]MBW3000492.1 hypothetical protein [Candidatus Woesearchaeota archaeon]
MRIIKYSGLVFVLVLILLYNLFLTSALGVSPARKTVSFEPNTTLELEFNIINSEQNSLKVDLSVSDNFSDIIFFEKKQVQLETDKYQVPFKVIFNFPAEMEPGIHKGFIKITPLIVGPSDRMFAAFVSPRIPISIRVPYPSKYADVSLVVQQVDEGTPVPIYVEFDNMGSEDILKAGAELELYEPGNILISKLSVPDIRVNQDALGKTRAEPSPILRRGEYRVVVNAYYDEIDKSFETMFSLGTPLIRIKELITRKLVKDEINKVVFKAYNEWNKELSVAGFISIGDEQSEMPLFVLAKDEERQITGFFDTTGLELGEYNMSITLIYANQIRTYPFLITITEKPEIIERPERVLPLIIILAIAAVIIILVIVLFIIKKRKSV